MNLPVTIGAEALPSLVSRAAQTLADARTSAEVLEARDMAGVAYQAAKSAGRMAKAKAAHDDILARVYRAQADALLIESRAKSRLADEYDDAQERGEVAKHGQRGPSKDVEERNVFSSPATAADLGLRRDEIHEAREIRDFERENPGEIERVVSELVERGEEPTKAKVKAHVANNTGNNEWYTPARFIEAAKTVMGGIDLNHYADYQRVAEVSGRPVWLLFLHKLSRPRQSDIESGSPAACPTGLFGGELSTLLKSESHRHSGWGRHGMVYWPCSALRRLADIEDLEAGE